MSPQSASAHTPLPYEARTQEQRDAEQKDRRAMLLVALDRSRLAPGTQHPAVYLTDLVQTLGIVEELEELAGRVEDHPRRHRRLAAARRALRIELGERPLE